MIKAVLFDLDGTVLASRKGVYRSAAYALDRLGYAMPDDDAMLAFLGPPLSDGFRTVCHVKDADIDSAIRLYREYYNGGGKFEAELFEGVVDCLHQLREKGYALFITTSKPHVFAKEILDHFNALALFDGVYGSEFDGTRGRKSEVVQFCLSQHSLSVAEAVLVGDRHFDVHGAHKCHMRCVGVTYGYGSPEELTEAGADALIAFPSDLPELLNEWNRL